MISVHTSSTKEEEWDTMMHVTFVRFSRYPVSHVTAASSKWLVGSSISRRSGFRSIAHARARRIRQPPLREETALPRISGVNPTASIIASTLLTLLSATPSLCWTYCVTVSSMSLSFRLDSTKTVQRLAGISLTCRLAMLLMRVVFPTPFCPTSPYLCPRLSHRRALCNRIFPPYARLKSTLHTSSSPPWVCRSILIIHLEQCSLNRRQISEASDRNMHAWRYGTTHAFHSTNSSCPLARSSMHRSTMYSKTST
mmetsp:Transcript_139419/g.242480  ORF Transcript_139419/g.242480 Transcript_139419/m.242480 type:complete len:254 (+) Transcript_139419:2222-2983(+)